MARIRTVKPEFWSDDAMLECSDSCALFYIALWNFCDDEGKIQNKPTSIAKQTARWSKEKVQLFIRSLSASGQLRLSSCSGWLQVVNWHHQRINRPLQPKVLSTDIQWVTPIHSVSTHVPISEHSSQGMDRKGKDRIGLESMFTDDYFQLIFDERTMENYARTFRQIDITSQLEKFKIKVRGAPDDYHSRDTGGMRNAFQYQLERAKPETNGTTTNKQNKPNHSGVKNPTAKTFGAL